MIKLVALLTRKPGMSEEDFHRHWREVHGPLVASTKSGQHALRYEQNHRADVAQERLGAGSFDGVTIQWFASMASFEASIAEDDYALLAEDMDKFLDMDRLIFFLTEDAEVVWDNLGTASG